MNLVYIVTLFFGFDNIFQFIGCKYFIIPKKFPSFLGFIDQY